jgi:hypothetical protein
MNVRPPPDPPSGGEGPPVLSAPLLGGEPLNLLVLATEICRRYREEFPDERGRYGEAGNAWCVHDNQHLLNWAVETVNGYFDIDHEIAWLANILEARQFPVDRLARGLDIGAHVTREAVPGIPGVQLYEVLTRSAAFVRSGAFRDYDSG